MKKNLLTSILFLLINNLFAQSFMHGAGLSVFVGTSNNTNAYIAEGLTYSPRFNFLETSKLSLSIGVPLSIGISGSYSYQNTNGNTTEKNTLALMFNAPLIFNLNVGRGSTKENKNKVGFFIGGGYGFYRGGFTNKNNNYIIGGYYYKNDGSTINYNITGPVGNIGLRIGVGRKYRNIETKLSLMKGVNEFSTHLDRFCRYF